MHMALAPLLVALALALAPRKLLLFGRLSGMYLHALRWISSHFTSGLANNNSTAGPWLMWFFRLGKM